MNRSAQVEGYPYRVCIGCTKCGMIQYATVRFYKGDPFPSYGHTCEKCGYEIGESEWNEISGIAEAEEE